MAGSKEAAFRADYEEFEWGGWVSGKVGWRWSSWGPASRHAAWRLHIGFFMCSRPSRTGIGGFVRLYVV